MEAQEQPKQEERPQEQQTAPFIVVLASGSPRRSQLLSQAGVRFTVHTADVDETLDPDLVANPSEGCKKLAERKAGAVVQQILSNPDFQGMMVVIGADTMVVESGEIFGKPKDVQDARRMLARLSGVTHQVMTAVSVWMVQATGAEDVSLGFRTFVDESQVTFKPLSAADIDEYLALGESFDKAGAYAVQGQGKRFVESVQGSLDTVIGLPVERLLREFPELLQA